MSSLNQDYRDILGHQSDQNASGPSVQPELKHLVETPDPNRYGKWVVIPIETFKGGPSKAEDKYQDCSIIFRQKIDSSEVIVKEQLEVQSEGLRSFFNKHGRNHRDLSVQSNPIIIRKPYISLFFLRENIRTEILNSKDEIFSKELQLLVDFMQSRNGLKDVLEKYGTLVDHDKVSFDILWTLFPPLEIVLYHDDESRVEQMYAVESVYRTVVDGRWAMAFELLRYHHNGMTGGICREKLITSFFLGSVDIIPQNLPIIPLKYLKKANQEKLKSSFIARGKRYIDIQSQKFSLWEYHDILWYVPHATVEGRISFGEDRIKIQTRGRVVVDAEAVREVDDVKDPQIIYPSFGRYVASFEPHEDDGPPISRKPSQSSLSYSNWYLRHRDAADRDTITVAQPLALRSEAISAEDDDYLLCPPRTDAFLLDKRIWIWVLVDALEPVKWYPNPFNSLQLPEDKKSFIGNLVTGFNTSDPFAGFDDVVRGKGKGLIFLFHGLPGLGKTFTAETIAEQTHRPLYHVTTGQLSVDVKTLESELGSIFKLGWRWGAVVLIDEADVLMSKRDLHDLSRSAIVAVFLRLIEYYQGLLFLTTNRQEDFDPAFYNRIHVSIEYPELSPESRTNIWRNLLIEQKDALNLDASWSGVDFNLLGDLECNGRDIRNLIRTAYGYAVSREKCLGVRHFVKVLRQNSSVKNAEPVIKRLERIANRVPSMKLDGPDVGHAEARGLPQTTT